MNKQEKVQETIEIKRVRLYAALACALIAGLFIGQGIGQVEQYNAIEGFLAQHAETGFAFQMTGSGVYQIQKINVTTSNGTIKIGNVCYRTNSNNLTATPCQDGGK
jgi:hypothetical protein